MPIKKAQPENGKELKEKIRALLKATKLGKESEIIDLVAADFKMTGEAGYVPAAGGKEDIILKGKCLIYCITGVCSVGHRSLSKGESKGETEQWDWTHLKSNEEYGYIVEQEDSLRLEKKAAVVIIYPT